MEALRQEGSKNWWAQKYAATQDYLYGKAPSTFLTEHLSLLKKGATLDVAMGEGRNAVYLASKGFDVTGVDWADLAIERATGLAKATGVSLDAKLNDLNFFLIPLMKYETIAVFDFHPPLTVLKSLARGLAKGGTLIMEGYTLEQLRLPEGPKPESFECFKPNEVLSHMHDLHVILYNERPLSAKEARVQLIARKPLR